VICDADEIAVEATTTAVNGQAGALRLILEQACAEAKCSAKALTVLAPANDPFRVDTPFRRRDGEWLAMHAARLGLGNRKIHLRGLHYMLVAAGDVVKPDGQPYTNIDPNWNGWSMTLPRRRDGSAISRSIRSSTRAMPSR
jgi:hypothetical protein